MDNAPIDRPVLEPVTVPTPPDFLGRGGRAIWDELAPLLAAKGRMLPLYRHPFASLCEAIADARELRHRLEVEGLTLRSPRGLAVVTVRNPLAAEYRALLQFIRHMSAAFGLMPLPDLRIDRQEARARRAAARIQTLKVLK